MSEKLTHNQDFSQAFLNHPSFIDAAAVVEDTATLAVYNYTRGLFELLENGEAKRLVHRFMLACTKKSISTSIVGDVLEQIKWLAEKRFPSAISHYLALTDLLLDTRTFTCTNFSITANAFFGLTCSSKEINLVQTSFQSSRFKQFLDQVLIKDDGTPDPELITLVQEMFGYTLLPSNSIEASFFLVGKGSNGKSVLLRLLEQLIGSKFCSSLSVEQMTTSTHATTALVGKRLNICTEEESSFVKSDKFKSLVSGEPTEIDYKFGEIKNARLPVKYIFATNELPTFSGFNHGLLRRIKIIPFKRTFSDQDQDRSLTEKLLQELPLITAWALEGAKRLVANGHKLSAAKASDELKFDFESNLSAAVAFIREEYKEDPNEFMYNSDLYNRFAEWCKEVGKKQMSKQKFLNDISQVLKLESELRWNKDTSKNERGRPLARISNSIPIKTVTGVLPTF